MNAEKISLAPRSQAVPSAVHKHSKIVLQMPQSNDELCDEKICYASITTVTASAETSYNSVGEIILSCMKRGGWARERGTFVEWGKWLARLEAWAVN